MKYKNRFLHYRHFTWLCNVIYNNVTEQYKKGVNWFHPLSPTFVVSCTFIKLFKFLQRMKSILYYSSIHYISYDAFFLHLNILNPWRNKFYIRLLLLGKIIYNIYQAENFRKFMAFYVITNVRTSFVILQFVCSQMPIVKVS